MKWKVTKADKGVWESRFEGDIGGVFFHTWEEALDHALFRAQRSYWFTEGIHGGSVWG